MGESVVIHKNVKLPKAAKIKSHEIVVITPSSFELYQICARHVTDAEYGIDFHLFSFLFFCEAKIRLS